MKLGQRHRVAGLVMVLGGLVPVTALSVDLSADRTVSTDGTVQLRWAPEPQGVTLQRADNPEFSAPLSLYQGTDTASLRTGLSEGDYFYRVGFADAADPSWSAPVQVAVRHHDAVRTWGLFGIGATVFVATLGLILWGWTREAGHD